MQVAYVKGALALVLAGLLAWICMATWKGLNPQVSVDGPLPGLIAAASDHPAAETFFWVGFEPPRPSDAGQTGTLRFSYRIKNSTAGPAAVSYVLSGRYADMIVSCEAQAIEIDRDLRFDDLPMSSRLALIALEQRGRQSTGQGSGVQPDRIEAAALASVDQTYTRVTIPVSAEAGGLPDNKESIGAEGNYACRADMAAMWNPLAGGFRIITPPVAAAAPYSATSITKVFPSVTTSTDDRFFLLRGTQEAQQSGPLTSMQQEENSTEGIEGFDSSVAASISATFSSTEQQDYERNVTLLIGVLLGAAASIFIGVLSGAFDLIANRRTDRPPSFVDAGRRG